MTNYPHTFQHLVKTELDMTQMARLLRAMPVEQRCQVAGIVGSVIGLRCSDDEALAWRAAWEEVLVEE